MKVNHHQIKNAIAHVSKLVERDYPNKKHNLNLAFFEVESNYWRFIISNPNPLGLPQGSTYGVPSHYVPPRYFARLTEIGSDESIALDGLFIETFGIGKVIDAGFGFITHAEKIDRASLLGIYPANLYMKRYPSWQLRYSGLDNKLEEIEIRLSISNQGVIFDVELNYPKTNKS